MNALSFTSRVVRSGLLPVALLFGLAGCDSSTEDGTQTSNAPLVSTAVPANSGANPYCPAPSEVVIEQYDGRVKLVEINITQGGGPIIDDDFRTAGDNKSFVDDGFEVTSLVSGAFGDKYRINRRVKLYNGSFGSWVTLGNAYGDGGSASYIDFSWFAEYNSNPFGRYIAEYKVNRVCSESPYSGSSDVIATTYVRSPYNSF